MTKRIIFSDEQEHTKVLEVAGLSFLQYLTAFGGFVDKHVSEENTRFRIELMSSGEALVLDTAVGTAARSRRGDLSDAEYARFDAEGGPKLADFAVRFGMNDYAALDAVGPWESEQATVLPDGPHANLALARKRANEVHREHLRKVATMPKLDRKALNRFGRFFGEHGHVNSTDSHYVLFGGRTIEEVGAKRDGALEAVADLGLQIDETPASAPTGEVWVRADPRVDLQLEKWS